MGNEMVKKETVNNPRCKRVKTTSAGPVTTSAEEISCSPPVHARPKHKPSVENKSDENWMDTACLDQNIAEDLSNRINVATDLSESNSPGDQNASPSLSIDLTNTPTDLTQGLSLSKHLIF